MKPAPLVSKPKSRLASVLILVGTGIGILILLSSALLVGGGLIHRQEAMEIIQHCENIRWDVTPSGLGDPVRHADGGIEEALMSGWKEWRSDSDPGSSKSRTKLWDPNGTLRVDEVIDGWCKYWDSSGRLLVWERYESRGIGPERRGICFVRGTSGFPYLLIW